MNLLVAESNFPWMLLDEAIDHIIVARHGKRARKWLHHPMILMRPDVSYADHPNIFIDTTPYDKAMAELRWSLADGMLAAYEEIVDGSDGTVSHKLIEPVEWSTLNVGPTINLLSEPERRIRLKRSAVESIWKPKIGAESSKSSYLKDRAWKLFKQNSGWPDLSQKAAARELRFNYESQIAKVPLPSHETCVDWIREWRRKGRSEETTSPTDVDW